ncbi:MAG: flagellar hook-basal body complex protein FliE [Planctomycetota bacterium]
MVNGIGGSGAGRAAIDAALKQMRERQRELGTQPADALGGVSEASTSSAVPEGSFAEALKNGLGTVEEQVDRANSVHIEAIKGELDLHEVAAQLKESEITFQFALQVRNKLMDAYREVMRMSV